MIKNLWEKYREIISYLFFGCATTAVNWVVYSLANTVANLSMNVSNVLAWIVAVLFAFVTNKVFVFSSKAWEGNVLLDEFVKFIGARVVSGIVEIGGLPLLYQLGIKQSIFGVEGFAAKIIVSVVVIVLNYIFYYPYLSV